VAAQRRLLAAGGARLRLPTLFGLVLASTGPTRMMPAGPVTGGFTFLVVILALLLAGVVVAPSGPPGAAGLPGHGAGRGDGGLTAALRHARPLSHWLKRHR